MKTAILGFGVVGSGTYEILEKNGYTNIKIKKDYNNTERVVLARKS